MQVTVRDNNVEQALRALKKKLQREGVFSKVKDEMYFTSKGEQAREARKKAVKRDFKQAVAKTAKSLGIPKAEASKLVRKNKGRALT